MNEFCTVVLTSVPLIHFYNACLLCACVIHLQHLLWQISAPHPFPQCGALIEHVNFSLFFIYTRSHFVSIASTCLYQILPLHHCKQLSVKPHFMHGFFPCKTYCSAILFCCMYVTQIILQPLCFHVGTKSQRCCNVDFCFAWLHEKQVSACAEEKSLVFFFMLLWWLH